MSAARERVLEQALQRVHAAPEATRGRARAIARAYRAGVRPRDELEEETEQRNGRPYAGPFAPRTRPQPNRARALRRAAAVAAVAAAAAGAALWWSLRAGPARDPGPPLARALDGGPAFLLEGRADPARVAHAGDRVRTDAEAAALELLGPDAGVLARVDLEQGSLLALTAGGAELVLGEARLAAAAPARLVLGFAALELEAGAIVRASLVPEEEPPPSPHARPARVLAYAVAQGPARLVAPDGTWTLPLAAGDTGRWTEGQDPLRPIDAAEREELLARLEAVWPLREGASWADDPTGPAAFEAWLDARPARWVEIERMALQEVAKPGARPIVARAWITLAAQGGSPGGLALGRALWAAVPEAFEPWHVVALARRGAHELEREAKARVLDPDDDLEDTLLCALQLGLAGDPDALALLRAAAARPARTLAEIDTAWLAAFALDRSGEPAVWRARLDELDGAVQEALDLRAPVRAAHLVCLAEFLLAERAAPGDPAMLQVRLAEYRAARGSEVQSPGEIRSALADLPR